MPRARLSAVAVLVLVGCGSTPAAPTPTPSARPTVSVPPTASPGPDVQRIDVLSTGVGSWQLVAVPVAVIHNAATRTGVSGVVVHFTLMKGAKPLTALESPS